MAMFLEKSIVKILNLININCTNWDLINISVPKKYKS